MNEKQKILKDILSYKMELNRMLINMNSTSKDTSRIILAIATLDNVLRLITGYSTIAELTDSYQLK